MFPERPVFVLQINPVLPGTKQTEFATFEPGVEKERSRSDSVAHAKTMVSVCLNNLTKGSKHDQTVSSCPLGWRRHGLIGFDDLLLLSHKLHGMMLQSWLRCGMRKRRTRCLPEETRATLQQVFKTGTMMKTRRTG